ncbi:hypothetical protein I551_1816 [Mycobacterium ulcerans str. Harvey]|uniref:Secreted protein n=1 Tax=Mycobacterium ulcerans str. Harvey TaxID=1299332 RepID=A0ABN0R3N3_MYCUL|nr:hypothetical protein I551_1816 [Mycobacterium ulcerans str. Harvey]
MATEPIVLATSLAAHGSVAPVAVGSATVTSARPGSPTATNAANSPRRFVALPDFMDNSSWIA